METRTRDRTAFALESVTVLRKLLRRDWRYVHCAAGAI